MEKINIAELLKDCPKGMELDCTMFENVTFEGIKQGEYPIIVKIKEPSMLLSLTKTGCWNLYNSAKCVIFPKDKTTWEGFVPPCKFKGQTDKMEEREIAFMDWWLENHKGESPTFADAIAWADKTMVEKACEWLSTETYSYTWVSYDQYESGVMIDKFLNDFRKAMEE